ncbi:hypothetical protein F2Q69_00052557 [Brassica cretica]|uniref:Uncharacterized protein n=1 Tax=Brassica cretica TaxID=69181 RepID=A0A8S9MY75_BRACR|nr:hypothetical protein F2Q69_00052557 [Brassica cretica]
MGCWVTGQGHGLGPEGLGKALRYCTTQTHAQPPIKYGRPRPGEEHGEPRRGSEGTWWAMAPSDRMDSPCDRTTALVGSLDLTASPYLFLSDPFLFFLILHEGFCWFSPRDTSLGLADHNRTASLDTGRLCGWFESHHGLGGWAKRLVMSQKARVAKGHELPKVVYPWKYNASGE